MAFLEDDENGNSVYMSGVRPVLHLDLTSDCWSYAGTVTSDNDVVEVPAPEQVKHTVSVDGVEVAQVIDGDTYKIPDNVVGYYTDGKLYKHGSKFVVEDDVEFTSVNIQISKAASIKYEIPASIRYKAKINATEEAIQNAVVSQGMLVTPESTYTNYGELNLNAQYKKVNIVSTGWYNNTVGTYCASLAGIKDVHYDRDFVARAYMTVKYADGSSETVYSNTVTGQSVSGIAYKLKNSSSYSNLSDAHKSYIDIFIGE
jgi:hypothetical protein